MNWYYVEAGRQIGPVNEAQIAALANLGTITNETMIWKEGMPDWLSYGQALASGLIAPSASSSGVPRLVPVLSEDEVVCAECHKVFPASETIRIGDARVCASCKPIFVQKIREGVSTSTPGQFNYASVLTRFGAVILDGLILLVVQVIISLSFGLGFFTNNTPVNGGLMIIVTILKMGVALFYETFFIGKYGATPGKMACKIQVVVADGSRVSYGRALARYFAKILSGLICLIGYLMAFFDEEKRALHDRICNTRVILK